MTPVMAEDWLLEAELAPAVEGDPLAPLYAGAADGLLVLPFCPACGLALELEQRVCDGCATAGADWRPAEPRGTVHAVTVVHRLERGLVRAPGPYPVADVETAGGHRLVLTSVGPLPRPPAIGDAVTIGFRRLGGVAVPAFHPTNLVKRRTPDGRSRDAAAAEAYPGR
ncbi:MAG: hypothetical protein JWP48_491 [Actinoallomurus sp.]|jgi:uncharacterized OB-fold protein|nr:hypothetical protein [Actinoallomurus sp.]